MLPSKENIIDAVKDASNIMEPKIKGFTPETVQQGLLKGNLKFYTGGFGIVLTMSKNDKKYAFKVWYVDVNQLEFRLKEIQTYLQQKNLPYFVDFSFNSEGLNIPASIHEDHSQGDCLMKTLVMQWIEGDSLKDHLDKLLSYSPSIHTTEVKELAEQMKKMFADLHAAHISHGDLQHGNIMVTQEQGKNMVKLIDYDSLYVPTLKGCKQTTSGLGGYQHPDRISGKAGNTSTEKDDYFSEKVIYTSLLILSECPELWKDSKLNVDDNDYGLLFREEDYKNFSDSYVYQYAMSHCSLETNKLLNEIREDLSKDVSTIRPFIPSSSQSFSSNEPYIKDGHLTKRGFEILWREDSY